MPRTMNFAYLFSFLYKQILKWGVNNGKPIGELEVMEATKLGHFHILLWAKESVGVINPLLCEIAATRGIKSYVLLPI
jgi:hypothetical protein